MASASSRVMMTVASWCSFMSVAGQAQVTASLMRSWRAASALFEPLRIISRRFAIIISPMPIVTA